MNTNNPYAAPPPIVPSPQRDNPYLTPGQSDSGNTASTVSSKQGQIPPIVIVGFVLALFGGILGAILCLVGLSEAKKRGAGENLAYAGIVISLFTSWFWWSFF